MCLSKLPSRRTTLKLPPHKRALFFVKPSAQAKALQALPKGVRARPLVTKGGRKAVQFSPNVSLRCHLKTSHSSGPLSPQQAQPSTWVPGAEIQKIQKTAKALSFLHRCVRAKKLAGGQVSAQEPTIREAARYSIGGESLRGLEHFTSPSIGTDRRRIRSEALRAVEAEQREQLIEHALQTSIASRHALQSSALPAAPPAERRLDHGAVARAYGPKARESLAYARQVAAEDAAVAAAILAEDLAPPKNIVVPRQA